MKSWKDLFRTHILERGLNYYEMGAVTLLERTENGYRAVVEGTEDYEVEIELQEDRVYDMFCSCPYAEDGNYCKHMAAVLYEIEEGEPEIKPQKSSLQKLQEEREELEKVIKTISAEKLQKLVLRLALQDTSLSNEIMTEYAPFSQRHMVNLKKQVDDIAYHYSDRGGFVNYYQASDYINELSVLLAKNVPGLISKNHVMAAFELVNCVFYEVGNRDMDDSDGGTTYLAERCYEYWKEIAAACSEAEEEEMFHWFKTHQDDYVIDYMQEYISDFMLEEFHSEKVLREKLQSIDEALEGDGDDNIFCCCSLEGLVLERIRIMKELKYSDSDIQEYKKPYRYLPQVRKLEIQEYLDKEDYENAIEVLKESKETDKTNLRLVAEYSRSLIGIYEAADYKKEYKQELIFYVFQCMQSNLEYICKLKAVCESGEWENYREKILESDMFYQVQLELLEKEGLFERLLKEVDKMDSIYVLDMYEKILKKHFPEETRDLYIRYVLGKAQGASARNMYKDLVKYLKKIAKYPKGKAITQEIADSWKSKYKRRTAMMDELRKAGF